MKFHSVCLTIFHLKITIIFVDFQLTFHYTCLTHTHRSLPIIIIIALSLLPSKINQVKHHSYFIIIIIIIDYHRLITLCIVSFHFRCLWWFFNYTTNITEWMINWPWTFHVNYRSGILCVVLCNIQRQTKKYYYISGQPTKSKLLSLLSYFFSFFFG